MKRIIAMCVAIGFITMGFGMISFDVASEDVTGPFVDKSNGLPTTMEILDLSQFNFDGSLGPIPNGGAIMIAIQGFIPGVTGILTSIEVQIGNWGGFGNLQYEIKDNLVGGATIAGPEIVPLGSLFPGPTHNNLTFAAPPGLTQGIPYYLYMTATDGDTFEWAMDSNGNPYLPEMAYTDDTFTYTPINAGNADFVFATHMEVPHPGLKKVAWRGSGYSALAVTGFDGEVYKFRRNNETWWSLGTVPDTIFHDIIYDVYWNVFFLVGKNTATGFPVAYNYSNAWGLNSLDNPGITQGTFYGVESAGGAFGFDHLFLAVGTTNTGAGMAAWRHSAGGWGTINGFGATEILNDATNQSAGSHFIVGVDTNTDDGVVYELNNPLDTDATSVSGGWGYSVGPLNAIDWCTDLPANDYAIMAGNNTGNGNIWRFNGTEATAIYDTDDIFHDLDFFPFGPEIGNAVVVGENATSNGTVCVVNAPGTSVTRNELDSGPIYGVALKGPSSPSSGIMTSSSGAMGFFPSAIDGSTRITANAVFPKLYWIGFNDTTTASRLEQQVPVNEWYNFTLEANYSQGWSNCEVFVEAWYDWGATGTGSVYPAETVGNRDLAFRLNYSAADGNYQILYPNGNLEVVAGPLGGATVTNLGAGVEDHRIVELPIYLGSQIRNATGSGFLAGETQNQDKNIALNDAWSWDFNVTVRDIYNPTAMDYSHAEFGIDETVSISVSGNPSGNAPPGSANNPMTSPSQITYSANTDYWVNVSIPHLYKDGIVGPDLIPVTDITVQNMCPNATAGNSDISGAPTAFLLPNTPMYTWGQAGTPIPAPSNGTNATGPFITNFNAGGWGEDDFTELNWWVTVQAGTVEGIYWAVITVTIDS